MDPSAPTDLDPDRAPTPWYRGNGFYLLVSLAAVYVFSVVLHLAGSAHRYGTDIFLCAILVLGVRSITRRRRVMWVSVILVSLAVGVSWLAAPSRGAVPTLLLGVLFFGFSTVALLAAVFREKEVTADTIFTAVAIYVLMGICGGFVYGLIYAVDPSSFRFSDLPSGVEPGGTLPLGEAVSRLTYFSYVTLTTLGYGDITPRIAATRNLATLEAMVGQVYVAVLLARLVAIQITTSRRPERASD